ncbi:CDP-diacylglycerol--glycerol-3-phosphate 3-phosphatidyltransferase 1, chloroplastic-like [Macadamia integrifolia]|uniref:CDP-diacylglycerol--glycerol-3-phosphate 3-phosphatidyltransferase 1, chloroplastic-like n=1 Tax=Macadamia integrifolia TaxID=60698 RepID=UPI001C5319C4|nr:CDP-diacylglycerol--glycerol-3-phosphate 3-phosphatidyltransferase 1, chloroplastic-like [Macadamia integrifolia]
MVEVGLMAKTKGSVGLSSSRGDKGERLSVGWRDGWRLLSCAYFGIAYPNARFRRDVVSLSPAQKAFSSASSSGSNEGLVADMGSENKDYRTDKDRLPSLPLNQNHHHNHLLQQLHPPKLLTLPTILTLGRVAAVPLLVCTFYANDWWGKTATTVIFIAAAITDWLDGYIARRMRLSTAFGAFLDPVADKV